MQPGEKSHKMRQDCKWKTPGAPSLWILEEITIFWLHLKQLTYYDLINTELLNKL